MAVNTRAPFAIRIVRLYIFAMTFGNFLAFLAIATLIALTPGPGIFYATARTIAGGRAEGLASSAGLGLGGMVHVVAGALGVSAIIMSSAEAFTALKIAGAVYLVWLGIKTWRSAKIEIDETVKRSGARRAFSEGILVEALNPKTAAFFLAFIPQFIDPAENIPVQFIAYGLVSVVLNTCVDVVVTIWAARMRTGLLRRPAMLAMARRASGGVMCTLGAALLVARR